MSERNCVVPLVVRLHGVPGDERLAEMSEAIARTVAGRLREANRVIAAREGWPIWRRTYAAPEIRFGGATLDDDLQRRVADAIEAGIARAVSGGPGAAQSALPPQFVLAHYHPPEKKSIAEGHAPAAVVRRKASPRRRRPTRGWRVLIARDFYTTIGQYADFFENAKESPIELGNLYAGMADQQRRVSLWLVQVDRAYRLSDLDRELSARAFELSHLRDDQELFWVRSHSESARKELIRIDPSGVTEQTIPDLTGNSRYVSVVRGEPYLLSGGRAFLTTMVLPQIRLADYLRLEPEIQLSLRYRDLEFLINPAGFESVFHVSWTDFLGSYGERETTLHILPMEVLRRAPWETIDALIEQATNVRAGREDARNWWRLEPLNRSFLDAFPEAVKQAVAGYTDSATLALSDSDRWNPWQPGWRAAILWASFQVTADQRFASNNQATVRHIADRLIGHLSAFDNKLEWWLQVGHIFSESFFPARGPEGVRTIFDLVMEELEARERGRWFNFLLDTLDTSEGDATRAFLENAFVSTKYSNHPRIVAMRDRYNANYLGRRLNIYFPDEIWLKKDQSLAIRKGGVVADVITAYSYDKKGQQVLVESRRADFEKALDTESKNLLDEIVKKRTTRDFDVTEFSNEVVKRAATSINLKNEDFKKVTITFSVRVTKIEPKTDLGLQHYMVTWNLVKSIDGGPWEDVPDTEREPTIDYLFDDMLYHWEVGRVGEVLEKFGLIIAVIAVIAVAWEAGVVAFLVEIAGGTTIVLSSITLSVIITLVRKGRKTTLEDFVWAAIEGYLYALTFRFAGLGARAIGRIGTSTMTNLARGAVYERLFTGIYGGAAGGALTVFAHGIADVLLGNGPFPSLGAFVQGMALGAVMGLAGEFIIGPALQAAFRIGGQTALSTIGEAVKLIRETGTSPARYAALVGEALGALGRRLAQFLEEKSVAAIMTALRKRLVELGEALASVPGAAKQRLELALFRRIFEVAEGSSLGRLEIDGLERLLAATEAGAAQMSRDELLFFLNGLARDPAQAQRILQGLGRLAGDRVSALIASGQLDALVGANHLVRNLLARDADLVWEVWNGGSFGFRIGDFEAWLGRISHHADDQQLFGLEVLRRPDQLITPEGIAHALDKGGLTNEIVAGLDRLYGAVADPATADAIMTGLARDNAQAYLLFLRSLSQDNVTRLADQGILQPLSTAPQVVAHARGGNLDILGTVAAIRGPGPGAVETALALLNRLNPNELRSFLEALNTLDSSLVSELARAGQLETLAGAPQLAGVIRSDPVIADLILQAASAPSGGSGRLSDILAITRNLPSLPESIERGSVVFRRRLPSGEEKPIIFEVVGRPDLYTKVGGGRSPVEARAMIELELIGIETVYAGTRRVGGQTNIIIKQIDGVGSKDIIGRPSAPLRPPQHAEIVTQRTIDDLERIYRIMQERRTNIGDFQFIVRRSDGAVFVNDPTGFAAGSSPSGSIRNIIDRFGKILRDKQSAGGE